VSGRDQRIGTDVYPLSGGAAFHRLVVVQGLLKNMDRGGPVDVLLKSADRSFCLGPAFHMLRYYNI
jgi:hypothetical protein